MRSTFNDAIDEVLQFLPEDCLDQAELNIQDEIIGSASRRPIRLRSFRPTHDWIRSGAYDEPFVILDLVDFLTDSLGPIPPDASGLVSMHFAAQQLEDVLATANHVWSIRIYEREDGTWSQRLFKRVPDELVTMANSVTGSAGDHLRTAWSLAFTRNPDPNNACHESIRAVEAALKPVIAPADTSFTLGKGLGELRDLTKWDFAMIGRTGVSSRSAPVPVEGFYQTLDSLWPGPARHGDLGQPETVSVEEGQAAVMTATWLVAMLDNGALSKK